jgi:hypothetical protein
MEMSVSATARHRQVGETSGSPRRSPHQVADLPLGFNLWAELAQLRAEDNWRRHRQNAKTLVKEGDLRVVLMTLGRGRHIEEHRASSWTAIQTLCGAYSPSPTGANRRASDRAPARDCCPHPT